LLLVSGVAAAEPLRVVPVDGMPAEVAALVALADGGALVWTEERVVAPQGELTLHDVFALGAAPARLTRDERPALDLSAWVPDGGPDDRFALGDGRFAALEGPDPGGGVRLVEAGASPLPGPMSQLVARSELVRGDDDALWVAAGADQERLYVQLRLDGTFGPPYPTPAPDALLAGASEAGPIFVVLRTLEPGLLGDKPEPAARRVVRVTHQEGSSDQSSDIPSLPFADPGLPFRYVPPAPRPGAAPAVRAPVPSGTQLYNHRAAARAGHVWVATTGQVLHQAPDGRWTAFVSPDFQARGVADADAARRAVGVPLLALIFLLALTPVAVARRALVDIEDVAPALLRFAATAAAAGAVTAGLGTLSQQLGVWTMLALVPIAAAAPLAGALPWRWFTPGVPWLRRAQRGAAAAVATWLAIAAFSVLFPAPSSLNPRIRDAGPKAAAVFFAVVVALVVARRPHPALVPRAPR
jgi:hypothetical protein